jgi:hypothetical protein
MRLTIVLRELAALTGRAKLRSEPSLHEDTLAEFEYQGVPVTLIYSPLHHPDEVLLQWRFVPLPPDPAVRVAALERLLRMDTLLALSRATLGVDPFSDSVVFMLRAKLADLSIEALIPALNMAAERARSWAATYFLDIGTSAGRQRPIAELA